MAGSEWFGSRPGGLNRYFSELYRALAAQDGVEVDAVAFGQASKGGKSWGPVGLPLLLRVGKATVDGRFSDVVDRHFSLYGRVRGLPRPRARTLSVVHFHGPWASESAVSGGGSLSNKLKRVIEVSRYAKADVIVVLSEAFKELLIGEYSVPADKIRVIPPGVRQPVQVAEVARERHPVVLCVRRLEKRMGIDVLLDAWGMVHARFPDAELRVIGGGSEDQALRSKARTLGLEGSVHFLGKISDEQLTAEYARCAMTVVPTRALEGFGLIALESLAHGKAPVVTDCGGLPDSVRDLDPTLIVAPSSPAELAERIETGLAGQLPTSDECREHAARFTWDRAAKAHLALYEELIAS